MGGSTVGAEGQLPPCPSSAPCLPPVVG